MCCRCFLRPQPLRELLLPNAAPFLEAVFTGTVRARWLRMGGGSALEYLIWCVRPVTCACQALTYFSGLACVRVFAFMRSRAGDRV
jgi:hypothetical protein